MSVVTDIILCVGLSEEQGDDKFPAVDYVNRWLGSESYGTLTHLNSHEGGRKAWQIDVFGGAFNRLDIEGFVETLLAAPWERPDQVQLIIQGEEDEAMDLINVFPSEYPLNNEGGRVRAAIAEARERNLLNASEIG